MNKLIKYTFFTLFLCFVSASVFGGEYERDANYRNFWERVHDKDHLKPAKQYDFQDNVDSLSLEQKGMLYNDWARTPDHIAMAFYLNLFGVPGLGNFMIGDNNGGGALLGITIGSEVLAGFGTLLMNLPGSVTYVTYYGMFNYPSYSGIYYFGQGALIVGLGLTGISLIAGIITPFTFSYEYNRNLAMALKLRQEDMAYYGKPMDAGIPILMNLFPGFGLGSFAQGDVGFGMVGLGADIAGIVTTVVGFMMYNNDLSTLQYTSESYYHGPSVAELNAQMNTMTWVMIAGASVYGVSKVFQVLKPVLFVAEYNEAKKKIPAYTNLPLTATEMNPLMAMTLNILPGFGLGSMLQQDALGGVIGTVGELGGLVTATIGLYSYKLDSVHLGLYGFTPDQIKYWMQSDMTVFITGMSIYGIVKLFNIIRPFWFAADKQNEKTAMLSANDNYFSMSPYVSPAPVEGSRMEIQFGMNWKMAF